MKSSYKVAFEETPGPLKKIEVQNDLDFLVDSCDSEP
jgi:hypothetical protein